MSLHTFGFEHDGHRFRCVVDAGGIGYGTGPMAPAKYTWYVGIDGQPPVGSGIPAAHDDAEDAIRPKIIAWYEAEPR